MASRDGGGAPDGDPRGHNEEFLDRAEILRRIKQMDAVHQESAATKYFSLDDRSELHVAVSDETMLKQVTGLLHHVEASLHRSSSYRKLLGTAVFFIVFLVVLGLQRDVSRAFAVEDALMSQLHAALPGRNEFGYLNSDRGATGVLQGEDEFYDWLHLQLKTIYADAVCGDGVCEGPEEYAGFGRFGCESDCGLYSNTTRIYVNFRDLQDSVLKTDGWDLSSALAMRPDPEIKWNIWSNTMQDYMLAESTNQKSLSLDVPDGLFELILFQTKKISAIVDGATIASSFRIPSRDDVPQSQQRFDFFYGDPREILAVAAGTVSAAEEYCVLDAQGQNDDYCLNRFSLRDFEIKALASYGLQGTIITKDSQGSVESLVQVSFCGLNVESGNLGKTHRPNVEAYAAVQGSCIARQNNLTANGTNTSTQAQMTTSELRERPAPSRRREASTQSMLQPPRSMSASTPMEASLFTVPRPAEHSRHQTGGQSSLPPLSQSSAGEKSVISNQRQALPRCSSPACIEMAMQETSKTSRATKSRKVVMALETRTKAQAPPQPRAQADPMEEEHDRLRQFDPQQTTQDTIVLTGPAGTIGFENYAPSTTRWWIIRPSLPSREPVRSITFSVLRMATEEHFDDVTVFACNSGVCREAGRFSGSDEYLQAIDVLVPETGEPFTYAKRVDCLRLVMNADEVRVRFVSDGDDLSVNPTQGSVNANPNIPIPLLRTNPQFEAAYGAWSTVESEVLSCPEYRQTITASSGQVSFGPDLGRQWAWFFLPKERTWWWNVAPPGAQSIRMSFSNLNLVAGYISMTIYACSSELCRELGSYFGGNIPPCYIAQNTQEIRIRVSTGMFSWYDFAVFGASYTSSTALINLEGDFSDGQCGSVRRVFTDFDKPFCHSGLGTDLRCAPPAQIGDAYILLNQYPPGSSFFVIRPPRARSIKLEFEMNIEPGKDFLRLYQCTGGVCTQFSVEECSAGVCVEQMQLSRDKRCARNLCPCPIVRNAEELRLEIVKDGSTFSESYFLNFGYESSNQTAAKVTTGSCSANPEALLTRTAASGVIIKGGASYQPGTIQEAWQIRPLGARSISVTFHTFALHPFHLLFLSDDPFINPLNYRSGLSFESLDSSRMVYLARDSADGYPEGLLELSGLYADYAIRYDPSSPCTITFNSNFLYLGINDIPIAGAGSRPPTGFNLTYTSSPNLANFPLPDGDCRLVPGVSDVLLTGAQGNMQWTPDFAGGFQVGSRGLPYRWGGRGRSIRHRWTIRPLNAQSITISFTEMRTSPTDRVYVRRCGEVTLKPTLLLTIRAADIFLPCPITVHLSCVQIDADASASVGVVGVGFVAQYTSTTSVSTGPAATQEVDYTCRSQEKRKPDPPVLVWTELCCGQQGLYTGDFWGKATLDSRRPAGTDAEDYRIVYRVTRLDSGTPPPARPIGALYAGDAYVRDFDCNSDLVDLPEFGPSEAKYDEGEALRNTALRDQGLPFDASKIPPPGPEYPWGVDTRVWHNVTKLVRVRGEDMVVSATELFLFDDRSRAAGDGGVGQDVYIDAFTCKRYRTELGESGWLRSDTSSYFNTFVHPPVLQLVTSLNGVPFDDSDSFTAAARAIIAAFYNVSGAQAKRISVSITSIQLLPARRAAEDASVSESDVWGGDRRADDPHFLSARRIEDEAESLGGGGGRGAN